MPPEKQAQRNLQKRRSRPAKHTGRKPQARLTEMWMQLLQQAKKKTPGRLFLMSEGSVQAGTPLVDALIQGPTSVWPCCAKRLRGNLNLLLETRNDGLRSLDFRRKCRVGGRVGPRTESGRAEFAGGGDGVGDKEVGEGVRTVGVEEVGAGTQGVAEESVDRALEESGVLIIGDLYDLNFLLVPLDTAVVLGAISASSHGVLPTCTLGLSRRCHCCYRCRRFRCHSSRCSREVLPPS